MPDHTTPGAPRELIWKREEELLQQQTPDNPTPPAILPDPIPVDLDAERAAYSDLLAFVAANKDPDTELTALSVEEFMDGAEAVPEVPPTVNDSTPEKGD